MEMSFCFPLQFQENPLQFDWESLQEKPLGPDPSSDAGYHSAASSLSPTSSVDSCCFSPASLQTVGTEQDVLESFLFCSPAELHFTCQTGSPSSLSSSSSPTAKKSRSRYLGKKRQTASEREKLRMRDLTKALHHLRTYLPPSVAPAGQTLTKIETLRLTIRYISYLSAKLGLSEEVLEQRRSLEPTQALGHLQGQQRASYDAQETSRSTVNEQRSSPQQSSQASDGVQFWIQQQQHPAVIFSGQC
uniref:Mesoderm posterior aa n=1 Tax=Oryzias latipes TaxID=8090 RepID=A0A3P9LAT4_ORYLA